MVDKTFATKIEQVVANIPDGKVTTYGDLAAHVGHPYASRIVGGVAHYGDPTLPWHRVVNRFGGVARGFPGGPDVQVHLLLQDGIICTDYVVDNFKDIRWRIHG